MPINAQSFWGALKARGYMFFAGVPDSTFGAAYRTMMEDPEIRYIPAIREDVALGVASAAYFSRRRAGVVMQNSGIGNIVNPLTSFSLIYKVPVLLVVGWRGYGGPPNDAPEHWVMGANSIEMFELLGIPCEVLESDDLEGPLDRLLSEIHDLQIPGALMVRAGVLE